MVPWKWLGGGFLKCVYPGGGVNKCHYVAVVTKKMSHRGVASGRYDYKQ